jgi:hypothetical protein
VFDQYLRTTQIPKFEFYIDGKKVFYRWTNCVKGFNLPLFLKNGKNRVRINPTEKWESLQLKDDETDLFTEAAIEKMYYIDAAMNTEANHPK